MFEDGTVDMIVIHHGAEHLPLEGSGAMFRECFRVLKERGSLLVFVPNMKELAREWLRGNITDYIFLVNTYGAFRGNEADFHRFGFTEASLREHLFNHGSWRHI